MMHTDSRVYVAGHRGLVGSALLRVLKRRGHTHLITASRAELDLTWQADVDGFFSRTRPEYVFLAAAKVGGIQANNSYPAMFIQENLAIQTNVIHAAWRSGVRKLLFLGSSCIYPRDCPQPIREEYLLSGPLELTNRPYAVAKIAGIEMCWAYNRQFGTRYLAVMPTNLYGPGDNYDLQTAHVMPAMIRKFHEAKEAAKPRVELWGTGTPYREFLYSDDLAEACVHLMTLPAELLDPCFGEREPPLVNVGTGQDLTIRELADLVRQVVGYRGEVAWDPGCPDGTPRKRLDVHRIHGLGWRASTALTDGIELAYLDYLSNTRRGPSERVARDPT